MFHDIKNRVNIGVVNTRRSFVVCEEHVLVQLRGFQVPDAAFGGRAVAGPIVQLEVIANALRLTKIEFKIGRLC